MSFCKGMFSDLCFSAAGWTTESLAWPHEMWAFVGVVGQGFEALQVQSWVWTSGEGLPLVWDSSGERWAPAGPCRPLPVKWVSSLRASVRKPQGTQAKGDSWAVSGFVVLIGVSGQWSPFYEIQASLCVGKEILIKFPTCVEASSVDCAFLQHAWPSPFTSVLLWL